MNEYNDRLLTTSDELLRRRSRDAGPGGDSRPGRERSDGQSLEELVTVLGDAGIAGLSTLVVCHDRPSVRNLANRIHLRRDVASSLPQVVPVQDLETEPQRALTSRRGGVIQ